MKNNTDTKFISDETVYKAKYFRIRKIGIQRNGKTFSKDFIERAPAVLILPYNENGELYLEYQYRDALEKSVYELVAGNMENDADPLASAKRELQEETGFTAKTWHHLATWELSVNMMSKIHVFAATDLTPGDTNMDEDEVIQVEKMPLEEIEKKIADGSFPAASHIAAVFLFEKMKKAGNI